MLLECSNGALANVSGFNIVVSDFELHSCYWIKFRYNMLRKIMIAFFPRIYVK